MNENGVILCETMQRPTEAGWEFCR
jgi:hypothetical protein